jgi:hypothetical protein
MSSSSFQLFADINDTLSSAAILVKNIAARREELHLVRASLALSAFELRETAAAARALTAEIQVTIGGGGGGAAATATTTTIPDESLSEAIDE